MTYIAIGLFTGAALVHLTSLFFRNRPLTAVSKLCLLPLLLFAYLVTAEPPLLAALMGGILGWMGDALLIKSARPLFFKLGLASFLLGHLAYIGAFLPFVPALNIPALVISLGAALILAPVILKIIRPGRALRIPVCIYSIVLELMSICALQLALYRRDIPALVIFAGSLCFMVSDTLLGYNTFKAPAEKAPAKKAPLKKAPSRKAHFWVMLSYIAAQSCILGGLSMMGPLP